MTRPSDVTVAPLGRTKVEMAEAGAVAARAFHHDPFFVHLTPPPLLRARGLAIFWRSSVAALGDRGEIYGARDREGKLVGCAAWVRPGGYPLKLTGQLRQSAGAFYALYPRPRALVKGTKYLLAIEKAHPKDPLWYLEMLVVDPLVQRTGIGGRLQVGVMQKADDEGVDCYLETQNKANLAYYGRFGYEVVEELRPVAGGPPLWTMRRAARELPREV